jgi:hypothetical protein
VLCINVTGPVYLTTVGATGVGLGPEALLLATKSTEIRKSELVDESFKPWMARMF